MLCVYCWLPKKVIGFNDQITLKVILDILIDALIANMK